jgi:hypothetical protein
MHLSYQAMVFCSWDKDGLTRENMYRDCLMDTDSFFIKISWYILENFSSDISQAMVNYSFTICLIISLRPKAFQIYYRHIILIISLCSMVMKLCIAGVHILVNLRRARLTVWDSCGLVQERRLFLSGITVNLTKSTMQLYLLVRLIDYLYF